MRGDLGGLLFMEELGSGRIWSLQSGRGLLWLSILISLTVEIPAPLSNNIYAAHTGL